MGTVSVTQNRDHFLWPGRYQRPDTMPDTINRLWVWYMVGLTSIHVANMFLCVLFVYFVDGIVYSIVQY